MAAEGGFPLVFGLNTFGDTTNDVDGHRVSHAQAVRDVVEEGVFAEQAGVGFFGIGEHHSPESVVRAARHQREEKILETFISAKTFYAYSENSFHAEKSFQDLY